MDSRGFIEVSTDYLVPAGAFEGTIDPLSVSYSEGACELHTSPEIEMKWLLSQVPRDIYQIAKCFRDDPPTGIHLREFTMLEFYRAKADYRVIIEDVKALMKSLMEVEFEETTMAALVDGVTGIDLANCESKEALRSEIERRSLCLLSAGDTWEDMFFKLLVEKIEPALAKNKATIVTQYPAKLSALAKTNAAGFVERFEIYWKGMELCNGCTELSSLEELNSRYTIESKLRTDRGKKPHPYPERLAAALHQGFPPCAGVAIGMDRLFWCVTE